LNNERLKEISEKWDSLVPYCESPKWALAIQEALLEVPQGVWEKVLNEKVTFRFYDSWGTLEFISEPGIRILFFYPCARFSIKTLKAIVLHELAHLGTLEETQIEGILKGWGFQEEIETFKKDVEEDQRIRKIAEMIKKVLNPSQDTQK